MEDRSILLSHSVRATSYTVRSISELTSLPQRGGSLEWVTPQVAFEFRKSDRSKELIIRDVTLTVVGFAEAPTPVVPPGEVAPAAHGLVPQTIILFALARRSGPPPWKVKPTAMEIEGRVYPGFKPVSFTDGFTNIFRAIMVGLDDGIYTVNLELELDSDFTPVGNRSVLGAPIPLLFVQRAKAKPIRDPKRRVTYLDADRFETIAYDAINPSFGRPVAPSTAKPNVGTAGADTSDAGDRTLGGSDRAK